MSDPASILGFHSFLLADKAREAYRQAIFQTVKAGDTVLGSIRARKSLLSSEKWS